MPAWLRSLRSASDSLFISDSPLPLLVLPPALALIVKFGPGKVCLGLSNDLMQSISAKEFSQDATTRDAGSPLLSGLQVHSVSQSSHRWPGQESHDTNIS